MGEHLHRARALLQQSRHDLASRELRLELAEDPDNAQAHTFLSLCLTEGKQYAEAQKEAEEAIRLAPDAPMPHYSLARVLYQVDRLREAEAAIRESIRLDPEDADYFALLAGIKLDARRWAEALDAAEQGLAIEPEHVGCNNLRGIALVKLGRNEEAGATIDAALARDPENATTHANQGWALLHRGDHEQAMAHFREALRLNPNSEWARQGIVTALKARHSLYGLVLRYFLWMSRLGSRTQWGILLVGYFAFSTLRRTMEANPELTPIILPALIAYGLFALLTWTADPLFALVLRLDRFGRLVLDQDDIMASNLVGASLLVALVSGAAWMLAGLPTHLLALGFGLLTIPIAGTFRCPPGRPRLLMAGFTALLAAAGLLGQALLLTAPGSDVGSLALAVTIGGAALSGWVVNGLTMRR